MTTDTHSLDLDSGLSSTRQSNTFNQKSEQDSTHGSHDENEPKVFAGQDLEYQGALGDEASEYQSMADDTVSRTMSRRLLGAEELYKEASHLSLPLPTMGGGKPYPPMLPDRDPYAVSFDGQDDLSFPHNWSLTKKIITCFAVGLSAFTVSVGSAIFAEGSEEIMATYHVGSVVATLGTSLYVFGFASGPVIWGPLSELYGRKFVLVPSIFGFICFTMAVGAAQDIQTIMICRFFAGFVGAAPLVVAPASMADIFNAVSRGKAMTNFAMVLFGGPMLAPILGGFIVKNPGLGWRYCSYFSGIIGVLSLIGIVFFMDETHHGLILVRKAELLRRRTNNWGIHAPHETVSLSLKEICEKNITRPLVMLFTEPILFLITLYNAFIYGLLYLFLTAVPMIFIGEYGFTQGVGQLPYISMLVGVFLGGFLSLFLDKKYARTIKENGGKIIPEARLPPMMIGGVIFAIGLFWLGWSGSYPNKVHWIVPTIGAAPVGMGLILIFLPCLNYIIDCYLLFAASALAGNAFLRSAFGAAFPLFARQMFTNMKIKWAATLLGCVSVLLVPVPFLFYKYGKTIRRKSKYAFDLS